MSTYWLGHEEYTSITCAASINKHTTVYSLNLDNYWQIYF